MTEGKISSLVIGFIFGLLFHTVGAYLFPYNVRAVNEKLVEHGMAYYSATTGDIIWRKQK